MADLRIWFRNFLFLKLGLQPLLFCQVLGLLFFKKSQKVLIRFRLILIRNYLLLSCLCSRNFNFSFFLLRLTLWLYYLLRMLQSLLLLHEIVINLLNYLLPLDVIRIEDGWSLLSSLLRIVGCLRHLFILSGIVLLIFLTCYLLLVIVHNSEWNQPSCGPVSKLLLEVSLR